MSAEDLSAGLDSDSWTEVAQTLQELRDTLKHSSDQTVAPVLEPRLERLGSSRKWEIRRALAQALAHYRSGAAPRVLSRLGSKEVEPNALVLRAAQASLAQWRRDDRDERERTRREETLASELGALRAEDPATARRVESLAFAYAAEVVGGIGHDLARSGQTLGMVLRLARRGETEAVIRHLELQAALLAVLAEDSTAFVERSTAPAHPVSVLKCLETALERNAARLERAGTEVTLRVSPEETAYVPSGQLTRALENVIRNACEALSGQLTIRAFDAEPSALARAGVVVEVEDTGSGMKDPEACLVPFVSSKKKSANEPHSGLGLAIVKRAVEEICEGRLQIESAVGVGTIVRMILPRAEAS